MPKERRYAATMLLVALVGMLALGGLCWLLRAPGAEAAWAAATVIALVPAAWWALTDLRAGRLGADVLAVLALLGTLLVGEYLAGAVVGVMLGTGRVLEDYAQRRARRELTALLSRAPRRAHLWSAGELRTVPVAEVVPGARLVVQPGEVVPVDGQLTSEGVFDESALTGEAAPAERAAGERVRSGVVNTGGAVEMTATATERDSTYAEVVRLAEQAVAASAPVVRLADRVAAVFLPVALLIAGGAWLFSGDPVRAVAVLVTATPCPLLLAVPVAITAGMSQASRRGVVVRDGRSLEVLGRVQTAVLDKTGTVTLGRPSVTDVVAGPHATPAAVLDLAAAVEQLSPHVLADAVVRAAQDAGRHPEPAHRVRERPGWGAVGVVDGHEITVGRPTVDAEAPPDWARRVMRRAQLDTASVIWVSEDGELVGALLVRDEIRPDASRTLRRLRAVGLRRLVLLTGDRVENATDVGGLLGLDEVRAQCSPADKVAWVQSERTHATTLMVGDGLNDAPALAAADVGIALGARGSTASAQMADAVITDDRIDRLADVVVTAKRTRRIAVQSAGIGMGLSLVAMTLGAVGWLVPVAGAVVQEGIDLAVILNALRAVLPPAHSRLPPRAGGLLQRFAAEHERLRPVRRAVREAADALSGGVSSSAQDAVRRAYGLLSEHLLPHERAEESELYPVVAGLLGSAESTVTMSREHAEIERLIRRLARHLTEGTIDPEQVDDLRATLYGLDAVLTLHFAQEEEDYFALEMPAPKSSRTR